MEEVDGVGGGGCKPPVGFQRFLMPETHILAVNSSYKVGGGCRSLLLESVAFLPAGSKYWQLTKHFKDVRAYCSAQVSAHRKFDDIS